MSNYRNKRALLISKKALDSKRILKGGIEQKKPLKNQRLLGCDLAGIRTQDPFIKSEMLCQLSYQINKF